MFNVRLLSLLPEARVSVVASVVARWLALLCQVALFAWLGAFVGLLFDGTIEGSLFDGAFGALSVGAFGTSNADAFGPSSAGTFGFLLSGGVLVPLVCGVAMLVLRGIASWCAERAGAKAGATLGEMVFGRVVELGAGRARVMGDGEIVTLMGEGLATLRPYFSKYVPQFFYGVLAPVTSFVVMAGFDLAAALVLLVCVPLMPASIMMLMSRAKRFLGQYWGTYVDLGGAFLDAVRGLTTLKVFGADERAHERLDAQAAEFRDITMRLLRVQLQNVTIMDLFTYGGIAVGCVVAAAQVALGGLCLGDALTVVLLSSGFFLPMRTFGSYFHTGMNANPVIDQVFTLLDAEVPTVGDKIVEGAQITIEARGLAFAYGEASDAIAGVDGSGDTSETGVGDVLGDASETGGAEAADALDVASEDGAVDDGTGETCGKGCKNREGEACGGAAVRGQLDGVDLTIRPNSLIGIAGPSGSGKSTLAALLAGDLVGYKGSLQINGLELREITPASIHNTITLVSSASHVFRGSFRSNLAIAAPKASDGALWDALRRARLADFVYESGGLDAPVEADGANLSGGQRQRLVFARALLRNTPVYVFDEATANIDAKSERYLLDAIQKIALSKTVIVISHRLPVLRYADEILVMGEGRVVERGTHQEMLERRGVYRSLWDKSAELEAFAASVVEELPDEEPDVVEGALAGMPGMMAGVMRAFMGIVEMEKYQNSETRAPEGHPSWIPLPRYSAGMSRRDASEAMEATAAGVPVIETAGASGTIEKEVESEKTGNVKKAEAAAAMAVAESGVNVAGATADTGAPLPSFMGLADATAEGADNEAIKAAMVKIRDHMKRPQPVRVVVDPLPPAHRSVFTIVRKCLALTSGMVPKLSLASALGVLGWLLTCGVFLFGAAGMVAACSANGVGGGSGISVISDISVVPGGLSWGVCAGGALVCAILRGPVHYGERLLTHDCTFGTVSTIRSRVFGILRTLAPAKVECRDAGDMISLLTSDIEILEGFYSRALVPIAAATITAVVCLIAAAVVCPVAAAVMGASYVVVGVVVPTVGLRLTRERGAELRAYAVLMTGFLLDSLRGMRDLLTFGRAQEYACELGDRLDSMTQGEGSHARLTAFMSALPSVLSLVGAVLLAFVCEAQVAEGALSAFAAVMLVVGYVASSEAVCAVAGLGTSFHPVLAAADRVLDVMEECPAVTEPKSPVALEGFTGLSFDGVTFGYEDGTVAVSDATFEVEPGTFVGITGKSGVGKTTLLKLAMRFWDVREGAVRINGVDVREVSLSDVHRLVSYMVQDTYLFEGSLRDNLLVARPDATDEELERALESAALLEVVKTWPRSLDTVIAGTGTVRRGDGAGTVRRGDGAGKAGSARRGDGECGVVGVSDGERQRIGLARAFLHDAPLFLLDEPTSNLDALNEAAILRSLCCHAQGKTVVIVSHRRAVAAIVDKLLVVE